MVPPFVPRLREGQSVTKYFEDEKSIMLSESSEESSGEEEPLSNNGAPTTEGLGDSLDGMHDEQGTSKSGQGQWLRRARLLREKQELGLQDKNDDSFERLKQDVGPYWDCWKSARKMELEAAEASDSSITGPSPPPVPQPTSSATISPITATNPWSSTTIIPAQSEKSPHTLPDVPTSPLPAQHIKDWNPFPDAKAHPAADHTLPTAHVPANHPPMAQASSIRLDRRKPKTKKRAKDKLLRDPMYAKEVMEVRKRTAFLGYTYRRMRGPVGWGEGGIEAFVFGKGMGEGGVAQGIGGRREGPLEGLGFADGAVEGQEVGWGIGIGGFDGACDGQVTRREGGRRKKGEKGGRRKGKGRVW